VEGAAAEIEKTLDVVKRNLVRLTHQVPMVAIEDLPKEVQRCVEEVPLDWVRLFRQVENAIIFFHDTHPEQDTYI